MHFKIASSLLCFLISACPALTQCRDAIPTDNKMLLEKKVLFDDAHLNKNYKQAIAPLNWLLTNAPTLSTSIYIKGAEVFDALAQKETDPARKQAYIDSLMTIYDLRIQNCGEEGYVISRKAFSFFRYNYNTDKAKDILPLMDKAIELNGNTVMDALIEYYMTAVRITHTKVKLTEEQITRYYDRISHLLKEKIKQAESQKKPVENYKKIEDKNLEIYLSLVDVNCDFVKKRLEPRFRENPTDVDLAKQIFGFMLHGKCTEDPLWLQTGEVVFTVEKDYGLAKNLGIRYMAMDNYEKAEFYFKEALALASQPADKADMQILLGSILDKRDHNKPGARELYYQALRSDPGNKKAYEGIGDLYFNSFDQCASLKSQADDRLVFLVAYDMYKKAGNTRKMDTAQSSFPAKTEIFEMGYNPGDKITVKCWINEDTIIRTRD